MKIRGLAQGFRIVCLLLVAVPASSCSNTPTPSATGIPTAVVQQGDVQIKVFTRGILNATHVLPLTAPPVAGATLQIVKMAHTGTAVKEGDSVLQFDPSQQEYNLAQSRNDLAQADEEITKAKLDAKVQDAEDQTALLKAKYAVRRAELDVSKNEIVSEIDAKKNVFTLDEARRSLAQLQQDIQSHSASNQAGLRVSEEKRNKARLAMQQAEENIRNMTIRAPATGVVVVHGNQSATGGVFFTGMTLPDYQLGDQVQPGSTVADVIDSREMEINADVDESDKPWVKAENPAKVQVDALPGSEFSGKVLSVTGAAASGFFAVVQRKFGVTVGLDHPDPRLRAGFTTKLTLLGDRLSGVTSVPREAISERNGKSLVYLSRSGTWEQQEVKVRAISEGRAVVEGVSAGATVALTDPQKKSLGAKPDSGGPRMP
jgi:HlyD family secretion protein